MSVKPLPYERYFEPARALVKVLSPHDLKYELDVPLAFEPGGMVLQMSCNTLSIPHIAYLSQRIMEVLGLKFVSLGGPENCCGAPHWANGDDGLERQVATLALNTFRRLKPVQVVSTCPDCDIHFQRYIRSQHTFTHVNIVEVLSDRLDELRPLLKRSVRRRVALHVHDANENRARDARNVRRLLEAIPGLEVVDARHAVGLGNHCLFTTGRYSSTVSESATRAMFEEACKLGANTLVVPYHGCYRQHVKRQLEYPVEVFHYLSLLAESLDIAYDETFKEVRMLGDIDRAVEFLRPRMNAAGVQEPMLRTALAAAVFI